MSLFCAAVLNLQLQSAEEGAKFHSIQRQSLDLEEDREVCLCMFLCIAFVRHTPLLCT